MRRSAARIAVLAGVLMLLSLSGCAKKDEVPAGSASAVFGQEAAENDGEADAPSQAGSGPDAASQAQGTAKLFAYGDFSVEVTNVKEVKKGSSIEDETLVSEYDIYVVYPGATATVKSADTFIDEETGLPHANWAFDDLSAGGGVDILDDMEPVEITPDIPGIYDKEASVYVLGFEVYGGRLVKDFCGKMRM